MTYFRNTQKSRQNHTTIESISVDKWESEPNPSASSAKKQKRKRAPELQLFGVLMDSDTHSKQ